MPPAGACISSRYEQTNIGTVPRDLCAGEPGQVAAQHEVCRAERPARDLGEGASVWFGSKPNLDPPHCPIMKNYDLDDRLVEHTRRLVELARRQRVELETDLKQARGMIQRSRDLLSKLRIWPKTNDGDG